jgi:CYTH domain-containing protein
VAERFRHHGFEVDEFLGDNLGLIIAEVELGDENENVELPPWIGEEVTGDRRFYNSYLSEHPYTVWTESKS